MTNSKILITKAAIQTSPKCNSMFLELWKNMKWYINKTLEKKFAFVFSKVQDCSLTVSWKPNSFIAITTKLSQDFWKQLLCRLPPDMTASRINNTITKVHQIQQNHAIMQSSLNLFQHVRKRIDKCFTKKLLYIS